MIRFLCILERSFALPRWVYHIHELDLLNETGARARTPGTKGIMPSL
jgi:hypothetical protein